MVDDVSVAALLADGDGVLSRLHAEERATAAALDLIRRRIEVAEQLVAAATAWRALHPQTRDHTSVTAGDAVAGNSDLLHRVGEPPEEPSRTGCR